MTATISQRDTASRQVTFEAGNLLSVLRDASALAAERDPDRLHGGTTAGRALISLAALAREAAGALGADPGPRLTAGPGVVVLRELATATRLLDQAVSRSVTAGRARHFGILVPTAEGLHRQLIEAVTTDGDDGGLLARRGSGMDLARRCRSFCRYAAMVFVGISLYALVTKSFGGHLASDWLHTALHLGSAAVAAYAGWGTQRSTPAVILTGGLSVVYLGLGVFGWFVDGLFLGTPVAVPLGPPDNVFHLLVGGAAAAVLTGLLGAGSSTGERDGATDRSAR